MKPRILIAGETATIKPLVAMLGDYYEIGLATQPERVELAARNRPPELILLTADFQKSNRGDLCQQLKRDQAATHDTPLLMLASDEEERSLALEVGCSDTIAIPFLPAEVQGRVQTYLSLFQARQAQNNYSIRLQNAVRERTSELENALADLSASRQEVIHKLARAGEFKDTDTGVHIWRMAAYAKVLALETGLSEELACRLEEAAPMHDIGKIGIPDAILKKAGKLDDLEWQVMRQHTVIGARILQPSPSSLMTLAASIAEHHHERWDGTGYPHGLAGDAIPLEARIVAIADVFDALTMRRPYKEAWRVEQALEAIYADSGSHFDPQLVTCFTAALPQILEIKETFERREEETLQ
uniref:Putative response regulator receiver n=1 Tax=Magnetococcus massalia (strain MO-1) TaxID=451514 RepID=A0A1S7LKT3_MAGMO|nr:Putative response regulator receiver [Candidatus Magnetococcus massalia]